jgi:cell division protein FtsN
MASPQYNPRRQHKTPPPKNNKHRGASPTTRNEAREIPGWVWFVAGIAITSFVVFIVKLSHAPQPAVANSAADKVTEKTAKALPATKEASKEIAKKDELPTVPADAKTVTKFDFYTLLPEREVIVPNEREAIKTTDKQKTAQDQTAAASGEQLLLQVGSFRSAQEAERRRAQVVGLGLQAKVESVVANGDPWFRVQAGPFTTREQLTKARDQLSAAGVESLLLKQKP